jgi:ABC-type branched-subunit amino acid transport system ATPase component
MGETIAAAGQLGITVIVVEHNMSLLMGVAEHVVVLDSGRVIATGTAQEIRDNDRVVAAYFGSAGGFDV